MRTKQVLLPLMLVVALAGCSPYVLAAKETYGVATDPRSLATQATDTEAELQIKAALLASPVSGTSAVDVYCRQGVVVLVGMVPSGSQAGRAAVEIARQAPNVKRVETYFVSHRPSWESDVAIKEQIRAVLIADPALTSGRVDIAVYAGHVVLVGVVESRANVQKFISDARSVRGVVAVTSYVQTVIASIQKEMILADRSEQAFPLGVRSGYGAHVFDSASPGTSVSRGTAFGALARSSRPIAFSRS